MRGEIGERASRLLLVAATTLVIGMSLGCRASGDLAGTRVPPADPARAAAGDTSGFELRPPEHPSPLQVAAAVELYLACDEIDAALRFLRAHPGCGVAPYLGLARALRQLGRGEQSAEMYVGALSRSIGETELMEEFAAADPQAFIGFLDAHGDAMAVERRPEPIALVRARALHALGRSQEALELIGPLESCLTLRDGDLASDLWCARWKLEVWLSVDPEEVERRLRPILEDTRNANVLLLMARLLHGQERMEELAQTVAEWHARHAYDDRTGSLMVALTPFLGWDSLANFVGEHPADFFAALALADHHLGEGREESAGRVLERLALQHLGESLEPEVLVAAVRRSPDRLLPLLDARVEQVRQGAAPALVRSRELGQLGDVYWELDELARADRAWTSALEIGSDIPDYWKSNRRRALLGVPFAER